ncbi:MAG: hypothetical protein ACLRSD_07585 [Oscillibacter sp.]
METTTNYKLPQWVKEDPIKMQDFNAAFASIDAALKAEVTRAARPTARRRSASRHWRRRSQTVNLPHQIRQLRRQWSERRGKSQQDRLRLLPAACDGE